MTSKRELLRRQRAWAESVGAAPDVSGYLAAMERNLWRPLSPSARAAFEAGGGAELRSRDRRPAKMQALHSSAALAVNFFDWWTDRDGAPLLAALGIEDTLTALTFETKFPTGLPGNPPNLDVVLELASGSLVAIESKFTEWLTPKRRSRPPFKAKYFEKDAELWKESGLPQCQLLAADMASGVVFFRSLDAAQLLKHALGLAKHRPARFALCYLYYEVPCPAAEGHRREITRFAARVGAELSFRALTYQALFEALCARAETDEAYLAYLRARYCPATSSSARR